MGRQRKHLSCERKSGARAAAGGVKVLPHEQQNEFLQTTSRYDLQMNLEFEERKQPMN
jgi:hypothetical protein